MKTLFLTIALMFAIFFKMNGQGLKIGDKVPNLNIGKIINSPAEYLKFNEIKSRLVILDYWATSCAPCIAGLPKMDRLQKQFGEEIFILPVAEEKEERIRAFWSKSKYTNTTSLPTVVNDTLKKYFPHKGVPFEVWILDGKVFAFTSAEKVNEKEIREVLEGKQKDWATAAAGMVKYDDSPLLKPVSELDNKNQLLFYTTITGPKFNVKSYVGNNLGDSTRIVSRLCIINLPIVSLYRYAYSLVKPYPWIGTTNRIIFNVKDLSKYQSSDKRDESEWARDNSYCYETVLPAGISNPELGILMRADLDKFFRLKVSIEKRKTNCWLLTLKPGTTKIKDNVSESYTAFEQKFSDPKTTADEQTEMRNDSKKLKYTAYGLNTVANIIETIEIYNNSYRTNPPIIDETNYKFNFKISMLFPTGFLPEFDELKAELNKHGLELKKGVREIDMFVLTERNLKQQIQ